MNPYQQDIARILGLSDPADLEAVEEAMRTARGTLDGLGGEFAEEARLAWHVVRAGRLIEAADIGIGHQHSLDPALHAIASAYVSNGWDGPLTRPMTFRARELERSGTSPAWVCYYIPAARWNPDMSRAQAGKIAGAGRAVPPRQVGYEALCRRCGDVFNPDLSYADRSGLEHYQGEDGRPCGGAGDIVSWW